MRCPQYNFLLIDLLFVFFSHHIQVIVGYFFLPTSLHIIVLWVFIYFSVANLLGNFSIAFTYETFIIIGLVIAVPLSSSKYINLILIHPINPSLKSSPFNKFLYEATFDGMKLVQMK